MDLANYYKGLLCHREALLNEGISDAPTFAMHVASHNALKDFGVILDLLNGPEKVVFTHACREFQYSLEAVIYGNYRHAFSSLRLSFELLTATMYFSAHQMKMNLWLAGSDDLKWASLIDPDNGVYSHKFMKAFSPELGSYRTQYMALSAQVYRECSEYVHGNPSTHEDASVSVAYDALKAQNYHDKVATVRLCVLFQFFARYLQELDPAQKAKVELLAMEAFGHLPEIQANFGAVGK